MLSKILHFVSAGKRMPIVLGLLGTALVLSMHSSSNSSVLKLIERLDLLIYDQRFAVMPAIVKPDSNRIAIIDLDERSLQAEGQFPWNRFKVARLVERLAENGVVVVGFDVTFPEPDRNIRDLLAAVDLQSIDRAFLETLKIIQPQMDSDQYFADTMESGIDVVLAINFDKLSPFVYNELPPTVVEIDPQLVQNISLIDTLGYTGNIAILQQAASGNGSMNQDPDTDGIVRRAPLVLRYGNKLYPSLSLEMARVYNFAEKYELITENYGGSDVVTGVRIGDRAGAFEIPTDDLGQVLIPYVGRSSLHNNQYFPYISATDVLNDNLTETEKQQLENSLVLVGSSANALQDIRATPLQSVFPGVEVHANLLSALLSSATSLEVGASTASTQSLFENFELSQAVYFPYKPDWEFGATFMFIAILGLAVSLAFPFLGPLQLVSCGVLLTVATTWINFQLWSVFKLDFDLVLLLVVIVLLTMINVASGFTKENYRRKVIKGMFDQYVPPAHIDSMLKDPGNYSFEGESKDLTVLFSDVRGFTSISETLTASQLKTLLNDLLTPLTRTIFKHHGTVDKYVGDNVMAFWGAPISDSAHRRHAVVAAMEMLVKVEELNKSFRARGLPAVSMGIGVNSGMMNVGDMGSKYRRSYTVLGDAVNLASRLESLTSFYGIKMLIGENTLRDMNGILVRLIDRVKVRGKDKAVNCYEPVCFQDQASPQLLENVSKYHQALECYFKQDWDTAERHFRELKLRQASDKRLFQVYLDRISQLRQTSVLADWDGAYQHTAK